MPTPMLAATSVDVPRAPVAASADLDEDELAMAAGQRRKKIRGIAVAAALSVGVVTVWALLPARSGPKPPNNIAPAPVAAAPVAPARVAENPTPPQPDPGAATGAPSSQGLAAQPAPSNPPAPAAAPTEEARAAERPAEPPAQEGKRSETAPRTAKGGTDTQPATHVPAGAGEDENAAPRASRSNVDDGAVQQAMAQAASRASGCITTGSPTGVAHVSVTFAASGDVISAVVQGPPFAHTLEGECIAAKFRALHVPAFSGDNLTARKNITLQ
jgi:hypothetical protein